MKKIFFLLLYAGISGIAFNQILTFVNM